RDVSTDDLKADEDEPRPAQSQQLVPDVPVGTAMAPVESAPLAPPEKPRAAVKVETLGTVEGPAVGTLDASNGGFEPNIWMGSSRADIEGLLARVPLASPDTATRALAKRVVLTKADAPPGSSSRALVTIRIQKLLDAGLADDAGAIAVQGTVKDDPD